MEVLTRIVDREIDELGRELATLGVQYYQKSCTATVFTMMMAATSPEYRKSLIAAPELRMQQQEQILEIMGGVGIERVDKVSKDIPEAKVPKKTERQEEYSAEHPGYDGNGADSREHISAMIKLGLYTAEEDPRQFGTTVEIERADLIKKLKEYRSRHPGGTVEDHQAEANQTHQAGLVTGIAAQLERGRLVHADIGGHSVAIMQLDKPADVDDPMRFRFRVHDPWTQRDAWFVASEMFGSKTMNERFGLGDVAGDRGIQTLILPTG